MRGLGLLFANKAIRVYFFGLTSIIIPIYLAVIGYPPLYVGIAIGTLVASNIFSNLLLTFLGDKIGRKKLLLIFSLMMFSSGLVLFISESYAAILLACFIGNISTTGTEAGPFQSVETGVLHTYVEPSRLNKTFGFYNLIGYSASSLGAFSASIPSYFSGSSQSFHLLFLFYAFAGLAIFFCYTKIEIREKSNNLKFKLNKDVFQLSSLGFVDAFGGGFVSQSILSYWFYFTYHVSLEGLGIIFFAVNVVTALSILGATYIASYLGNLRTMIYTHVISNIFLIAIPLAGSLLGSLAFLFLRQGMSQMDVPTRQAFMAEIFDPETRVSSFALTNTFRNVGSVFGGPISGAMLGAFLYSYPLITGGVSKLVYDGSTFALYRKRAK